MNAQMQPLPTMLEQTRLFLARKKVEKQADPISQQPETEIIRALELHGAFCLTREARTPKVGHTKYGALVGVDIHPQGLMATFEGGDKLPITEAMGFDTLAIILIAAAVAAQNRLDETA